MVEEKKRNRKRKRKERNDHTKDGQMSYAQAVAAMNADANRRLLPRYQGCE